MPYDYQRMGRIAVDPRVVERIERSSKMRAEQGEGFMEAWGGPTRYRKVLTKLPKNQRLTYAAVLEKHTDPIDISVVTGLTVEQVDKALAELEGKGLVAIQLEK